MWQVKAEPTAGRLGCNSHSCLTFSYSWQFHVFTDPPSFSRQLFTIEQNGGDQEEAAGTGNYPFLVMYCAMNLPEFGLICTRD